MPLISIDELIVALCQQLRSDIERIQLSDGSEVAAGAVLRLEAVAEHAPAFIALLAEPWLRAGISDRERMLLIDCARIHLYARVLDDAIDEAAPVHRQNLLRAQPLFWQAVQRIGSMVPTDIADEAVALINETVSAVQSDDQQRNPDCWGAKNYHLLLIPLLLSNGGPAYQQCRSGLSTLIALVQAGDEWRQGELDSEPLQSRFLEFLTTCLDGGQLELMIFHGWQGAAERIVWNARQLLESLSR